MDTILHPFQRTGKDCINILNLGYDYSIGSLDKLDVKPHLQNQHISSFVVDSLSESKEKLAKEHDSNPGVRLRVFFIYLFIIFNLFIVDKFYFTVQSD